MTAQSGWTLPQTPKELLAPRSLGSGWVYSTAFSVTGGKTLPIGDAR